MLQDFKFPKKTLLILGNEAKGMKSKYIDVLFIKYSFINLY